MKNIPIQKFDYSKGNDWDNKYRIIAMHHKCGSGFLSSVMSEIARYNLWRQGSVDYLSSGEIELFQGELITISNCHYGMIPNIDLKGVHVFRDPRDLLVSAYYSHKYSHPIWPELVSHRAALKQYDISKGLLLELDFSEEYFKALREWDTSDRRFINIDMESMFDAFYDQLKCIWYWLDCGTFNQKFINNIIDKFSFEKVTGGRKLGEVDDFSHYRKGVPGEWITHFSDYMKKVFKERYGDLIIKYGYEISNDW